MLLLSNLPHDTQQIPSPLLKTRVQSFVVPYRSVVPLKRLEALPGCPDLLGAAMATAEDMSAAQQGPEFMAMDGAALENLEVCCTLLWGDLLLLVIDTSESCQPDDCQAGPCAAGQAAGQCQPSVNGSRRLYVSECLQAGAGKLPPEIGGVACRSHTLFSLLILVTRKARTTQPCICSRPGVPCAAGAQHVLCGVQVLESTEGGRSGTLMAALDHCSTPAGQALSWDPSETQIQANASRIHVPQVCMITAGGRSLRAKVWNQVCGKAANTWQRVATRLSHGFEELDHVACPEAPLPDIVAAPASLSFTSTRLLTKL